MSDVLELTCELVRRASVTPEDAGCQELIAARLKNTGFAISVKALVLTLSVFGLSTLWMAVFADVGVTVLAILNDKALSQNDV